MTMDYRHGIIIGSVIFCMSTTLGGLNYYYSPHAKNTTKKIYKNNKAQAKKDNSKKETATKYTSNSKIRRYVKPAEHTLMVDSEKDSKKFTGIMNNLGVVIK